MGFSWSVFLGKFKFTNEIKLTDNILDFNPYGKNNIKEGFEFDSLDSDGFQIFTDYNTSVSYSFDTTKPAKYFFPVYVVNETSHPKYFSFKRSSVFAIQEASINEKVGGTDMFLWQPIEAKFINFIASGYRTARVEPGEFILFLMPKYNGSETSLMRVRLRLGENVIVSKSFLGKFNPSQTILKTNTDILPKPSSISKKEAEMITTGAFIIQWLFNGAIPKEFDFFKN
jgi:hypothetical protein